jgi:hypothetical protein
VLSAQYGLQFRDVPLPSPQYAAAAVVKIGVAERIALASAAVPAT